MAGSYCPSAKYIQYLISLNVSLFLHSNLYMTHEDQNKLRLKENDKEASICVNIVTSSNIMNTV